MEKKTLEELMSRQREINDTLGSIEAALQTRELNDEEVYYVERFVTGNRYSFVRSKYIPPAEEENAD